MPALLLASLVAWTAVVWPPTGLEHGSLVIAMPVASGWVVCGDKRKNSKLFDSTEDEVKVFALANGRGGCRNRAAARERRRRRSSTWPRA